MRVSAAVRAQAGFGPAVHSLAAAECCAVFGIATAVYVLLQGELPYHDAARFTGQVAGGTMIWDVAHILLQPLALVLQQTTGAAPDKVLKALSSVSTAVAIGVFWVLLRSEASRWRAAWGTLLLAGCCSVLTLAPSAHPKLVAFPFVNGALLCLHMAERDGMRDRRLIAWSAALLAVAAAFLASSLAVVPFAALAVLAVSRRHGADWITAIGRGALFGLLCGITFLVIACVCYVGITGEPLTLSGLTKSVAVKADLKPPALSLPVHLARAVFGTVNNLIALPGFGATAQAWVRSRVWAGWLLGPPTPAAPPESHPPSICRA